MSRPPSEHILTITAPAGWIRSNDHTHWRNRHNLTSQWRTAAAWAARAAHTPTLEACTIVATVHRADNRRYDLDGITPTVKACIDGLRDVGVLEEDHCDIVRSLTIEPGDPWADAALVLRLTPTERRTRGAVTTRRKSA
jgi:hypothetical protein